MTESIMPFLTAIAAATRPLGAALPALETPPATSPWTPRPEPAPAAPTAPSAPLIDVDALRAEACEAGRAEGLRETEALRARLAQLADALEAAKAALTAPAADLIAEAAIAVIAAWTETADRRELFAPIIRAWIERCQAPSTARVHPSDAEAMRAVIGDAAILVEPDASVERGGVHLRAATLELTHTWETRLRELREAIAAELEELA
jgi:flagellar biosynthesis/type III secretory pathway protein FliH